MRYYIKKIVIKIRKIIYWGNKYQCNICKSNVRKFKPFGIKHEIFKENIIAQSGYRKNCICPVCKSKDRIRLVYYYLDKYTDIFSGTNNILHIAPEYMIKQKILKNPKVSYIDGDLKENVASTVIDITKMNFDDNTFDYIICNQVLEHVIEEEKALLELKRVIKPSKRIIITVPICISNENTIEYNNVIDPQKRLELYCQEDHVRLYGTDFKKRLEKYGFNVEEYKFEYAENMDEIKKYAFPKYGAIFIATKPSQN